MKPLSPNGSPQPLAISCEGLRILKQELAVYRLVYKDPRTPRLPRFCLVSPSVRLVAFRSHPRLHSRIGHLDDLIIVPGLVIVSAEVDPPEVVADCRRAVTSPSLSFPIQGTDLIISAEEHEHVTWRLCGVNYAF